MFTIILFGLLTLHIYSQTCRVSTYKQTIYPQNQELVYYPLYEVFSSSIESFEAAVFDNDTLVNATVQQSQPIINITTEIYGFESYYNIVSTGAQMYNSDPNQLTTQVYQLIENQTFYAVIYFSYIYEESQYTQSFDPIPKTTFVQCSSIVGYDILFAIVATCFQNVGQQVFPMLVTYGGEFPFQDEQPLITQIEIPIVNTLTTSAQISTSLFTNLYNQSSNTSFYSLVITENNFSQIIFSKLYATPDGNITLVSNSTFNQNNLRGYYFTTRGFYLLLNDSGLILFDPISQTSQWLVQTVGITYRGLGVEENSAWPTLSYLYVQMISDDFIYYYQVQPTVNLTSQQLNYTANLIKQVQGHLDLQSQTQPLNIQLNDQFFIINSNDTAFVYSSYKYEQTKLFYSLPLSGGQTVFYSNTNQLFNYAFNNIVGVQLVEPVLLFVGQFETLPDQTQSGVIQIRGTPFKDQSTECFFVLQYKVPSTQNYRLVYPTSEKMPTNQLIFQSSPDQTFNLDLSQFYFGANISYTCDSTTATFDLQTMRLLNKNVGQYQFSQVFNIPLSEHLLWVHQNQELQLVLSLIYNESFVEFSNQTLNLTQHVIQSTLSFNSNISAWTLAFLTNQSQTSVIFYYSKNLTTWIYGTNATIQPLLQGQFIGQIHLVQNDFYAITQNPNYILNVSVSLDSQSEFQVNLTNPYFSFGETYSISYNNEAFPQRLVLNQQNGYTIYYIGSQDESDEAFVLYEENNQKTQYYYRGITESGLYQVSNQSISLIPMQNFYLAPTYYKQITDYSYELPDVEIPLYDFQIKSEIIVATSLKYFYIVLSYNGTDYLAVYQDSISSQGTLRYVQDVCGLGKPIQDVSVAESSQGDIVNVQCLDQLITFTLPYSNMIEIYQTDPSFQFQEVQCSVANYTDQDIRTTVLFLSEFNYINQVSGVNSIQPNQIMSTSASFDPFDYYIGNVLEIQVNGKDQDQVIISQQVEQYAYDVQIENVEYSFVGMNNGTYFLNQTGLFLLKGNKLYQQIDFSESRLNFSSCPFGFYQQFNGSYMGVVCNNISGAYQLVFRFQNTVPKFQQISQLLSSQSIVSGSFLNGFLNLVTSNHSILYVFNPFDSWVQLQVLNCSQNGSCNMFPIQVGHNQVQLACNLIGYTQTLDGFIDFIMMNITYPVTANNSQANQLYPQYTAQIIKNQQIFLEINIPYDYQLYYNVSTQMLNNTILQFLQIGSPIEMNGYLYLRSLAVTQLYSLSFYLLVPTSENLTIDVNTSLQCVYSSFGTQKNLPYATVQEGILAIPSYFEGQYVINFYQSNNSLLGGGIYEGGPQCVSYILGSVKSSSPKFQILPSGFAIYQNTSNTSQIAQFNPKVNLQTKSSSQSLSDLDFQLYATNLMQNSTMLSLNSSSSGLPIANQLENPSPSGLQYGLYFSGLGVFLIAMVYLCYSSTDKVRRQYQLQN